MNKPLGTQTVMEAVSPEPPIQERKKRTTVADLEKDLNEIRTDSLAGLLNWCGELDARLDKLDGNTPGNMPTIVADLNDRLDMLESTVGSGELQLRLGAEQRIEALETATGALADALRSHIEEAANPLQELKPELEFATPPAQPAGGRATAGDIEAVASVCLTMNDVLTICRALKDMPDLPDQEKIRILNLACRTAGVPDTQGLRIRAGISATEAAGGR